jgi:hypothetical protein
MMRAAPSPRRLLVWSSVVAGAIIFVAANWHLVHVAINSQPDCVAHVRVGERSGQSGALSAARSSCTPPATGVGRHE